MPYDHFNDDLPDGDISGVSVPTDARKNLQAMRDMIVGGFAFNWKYIPEVGNGTEVRPQYYRWNNKAKPNEWLEAEVTWGTVGGSKNNPILFAYRFSSDNQVTYDLIGTYSQAYSANGVPGIGDWV